MPRRSVIALGLVILIGTTAPAVAACQTTGSFDKWIEAFRKEAVAAGISQRTISRALDGVTLDPGIIARDRRQGFFAQSFLDFAAKIVPAYRIDNGRRKLTQHKALFAKVEQTYGVPGAVITAFWGLESDFGAGSGSLPVLRSLATLAYDCRRSELFRAELLDALRIVERGDLSPADMIGSWAGELGQTQFLPSHYVKHAVDFDGDGRRDLIRSTPDVIASTAAFIKSIGWRPGEPWLHEVRVPRQLSWQEADLAIRHPRSQWAAWGVTRADGRPLDGGDIPASLLLPMGRNGPAFLAYANFAIFTEWNHSLTYATTAAYFATRLDGANAMSRGANPPPVLSMGQAKELQQLLAKRGYSVGEIDGKLGAATRAAVKQAQLKLGLPADSFPTVELIEQLRRR